MDREDLFQKARQFDNGKGTPNLELAELYGYMADFALEVLKERDAEIADEIKVALASEFIDNSPSAFRSRFHTIENRLRETK